MRACNAVTAFPLAKADGLIEACSRRARRCRRQPFPLAKADGLIEARYPQRFEVSIVNDSRWRKPTASLKLDEPVRSSVARAAFPLAKADGLIEAES